MIFEDGSREPLHGHNYRVMLKGEAPVGKSDMVFDFLDIKPIVREVCNSLDHKLLIPKDHPLIKIYQHEKNIVILTPDQSEFSIPRSDVLLLPILNTSSERIAEYLAKQVVDKVEQKYNFRFKLLEIEVEETPGQSAVFIHSEL